MVDGIPMHSTVSSYYGFESLGTLGVASIEIARGSGSMLALSLFFSLIFLQAESYFRLDKNIYEPVRIPQKGIVTFISEGCSSCKLQINDFKNCVRDIPVVLFMEGQGEDRLRLELKRRPPGYPVYWTTEKLKNEFKIGRFTPSKLSINHDKVKIIVGRMSCEKLLPLMNQHLSI